MYFNLYVKSEYLCCQVSEDSRSSQGASPAMDGLAGALARALLERSKAIHQTGKITPFDD